MRHVEEKKKKNFCIITSCPASQSFSTWTAPFNDKARSQGNIILVIFHVYSNNLFRWLPQLISNCCTDIIYFIYLFHRTGRYLDFSFNLSLCFVVCTFPAVRSTWGFLWPKMTIEFKYDFVCKKLKTLII